MASVSPAVMRAGSFASTASPVPLLLVSVQGSFVAVAGDIGIASAPAAEARTPQRAMARVVLSFIGGVPTGFTPKRSPAQREAEPFLTVHPERPRSPRRFTNVLGSLNEPRTFAHI